MIEVVGEEREFASKLMDDWLCPRYTTMNKPHVRMSSLFDSIGPID